MNMNGLYGVMNKMNRIQIEKLDGLYLDVWDMINENKKSDRIAFFKIWLKHMLGDNPLQSELGDE